MEAQKKATNTAISTEATGASTKATFAADMCGDDMVSAHDKWEAIDSFRINNKNHHLLKKLMNSGWSNTPLYKMVQ